MEDLQFFKYDPVVDGDKTFNIDKALNENWDKIAARDVEIRTDIDAKADDDFAHIPLVVCETAGDVRIKEITLPDYTAEKYPMFAVKFTNENTYSGGMLLKVNGGSQKLVTIGQNTRTEVNPTIYPIGAGSTVILTETSYNSYAVVNSAAMASTECFGQVIVAEDPTREYGYQGTAASPRYVNTALDNFNDFTHIPLVTCETAGDQQVREITIPGFAEEKYPLFAVKFINENTSTGMPKLSINGVEHTMRIGAGHGISAKPERYPIKNNDIVLFQQSGLTSASAPFVRILNGHGMATETTAGVAMLSNSWENVGSFIALSTTGGQMLHNKIMTSLLPYSAKNTYSTNALVMQDGAIYKSLQDNNTGHAVTESDWWEKYGGSVKPEPDPEQVINYTMLYDQGDECGEVTGGWDKTYARGISGSTETITKLSGYIRIRGNGSGSAGAIIAAGPSNQFAGHDYFIVRTEALETSSASGGVRSIIAVCGPQGCRIDEAGLTSVKKSANSAFDGCLVLDIRGKSGYLQIGQVVAKDSDSTVKVRHALMLKSDNTTKLLTTAGISTTYATPEALAADATARNKILSNSQAVKIMTLTCTGDVMYAVLSNADWIAAIKANDEAYRIIMANPHWSKFVGIIPAAKDLLNYTMLYDTGDECESVTGGWSLSYKQYAGSVVTSQPYTMTALTKQATCLSGGVPGGNLSASCFTSKNKITIAGYSDAIVRLDASGISGGVSNGAGLKMTDSLSSETVTEAIDAVIRSDNDKVILSDLNKTSNLYVTLHVTGTGSTSTACSASFYNCALLRADPYLPWLTAAGITKSFASLGALLSDAQTLAILMSNRDAISYMLSCTGTLMAGVCNSETAMSALVNSPVAYDAAFENAHWYKFMTMCPVSLAAMDGVAKTVPSLTGYTYSGGTIRATTEVTSGGVTYYAWRAFDGLTGQEDKWRAELADKIECEFTTPISVYAFTVTSGYTSSSSIGQFRLQGTNDPFTSKASDLRKWVDLTPTYSLPYRIETEFVVPKPAAYKTYRLTFSYGTCYSGASVMIQNWQLYGKEVI